MAAPSALPKTVKVGPFTYTVHVGGPMHDASCLKAADPTLMGYCNHSLLAITIQEGLVHDALCEVLIHEVLHACFNAVGQPLDEMNTRTVEENAVRTLAPVFLATMRANPRLVAFLSWGT